MFSLECGVPQGFCLGPILFTLYRSKLFETVKTHLPEVHCYADDTQAYISLVRPAFSLKGMENRGYSFVDDNLKLNDDRRTEFLIIGTP